jgi:hypothetical protein
LLYFLRQDIVPTGSCSTASIWGVSYFFTPL